MAMENKRIIQLSTERLTLSGDDYVMVDSATDGSAKYRLDRLKETDTTLSVSGMAADAAATGQAINDEAEARAAADTALGEDISDLLSAMSDAETAIEQLDEQKADSNRSYDNMTVGTAENVLSGKYALESVPYQFRKTGGDASVGSRLKEKIVGGTVAWNQLFTNPTDTLSFTTTDVNPKIVQNGMSFIANHKYLLSCKQSVSLTSVTKNSFILHAVSNTYPVDLMSPTLSGGIKSSIIQADGTDGNGYVSLWVHTPSVDVSYTDFNCIDLTAMFGTTIADHIYTLEQTTAGAGVALFRELFPKDYYAHDEGSLQSVSGLQSHDEVGFNQWDEEWEVGFINASTGANQNANDAIRSKNYIPIVGGETYYIRTTYTANNQRPYLHWYDADKNWIGYANASVGEHSLITKLPNNARYLRFSVANLSTPVSYNNDICINISDPVKNGTYEPYVKHSYPLDSSLTLRGVPKLVDNTIKFDGDVYESDGKVTRRYGIMDLGTLTWTKGNRNNFDTGYVFSSASITSTAKANENIMCSKLTPLVPRVGAWENVRANFIELDESKYIIASAEYPDAASFKAAMSGVYLVYELATPTTEEAQPFVNPQICDKYGTEEYVSTSIVPVGHETEYFEDVVAKVDGLPWDLSMIAPIDNGTTATRAYTTGQYFMHNDQFCKAKTDIASGATFTLNTNYEVTTVAAELYTALH